MNSHLATIWKRYFRLSGNKKHIPRISYFFLLQSPFRVQYRVEYQTITAVSFTTLIVIIIIMTILKLIRLVIEIIMVLIIEMEVIRMVKAIDIYMALHVL